MYHPDMLKNDLKGKAYMMPPSSFIDVEFLLRSVVLMGILYSLIIYLVAGFTRDESY